MFPGITAGAKLKRGKRFARPTGARRMFPGITAGAKLKLPERHGIQRSGISMFPGITAGAKLKLVEAEEEAPADAECSPALLPGPN